MKLSKYFHLEEFTRSDMATLHGIRNIPSEQQIERMRWLALFVLDPTREKFGRIYVSSGLRVPELNSLVGGASDIGHKYEDGHAAADIQPREAPIGTVFEWMRMQNWPLHKLILERGRKPLHEYDDCIHVEIAPDPKRLVMLGPTHGQGKYTVLTV